MRAGVVEGRHPNLVLSSKVTSAIGSNEDMEVGPDAREHAAAGAVARAAVYGLDLLDAPAGFARQIDGVGAQRIGDFRHGGQYGRLDSTWPFPQAYRGWGARSLAGRVR